jgi:hypothetical protein
VSARWGAIGSAQLLLSVSDFLGLTTLYLA